ncbi:hypothetical protein BGX27_003252, partial [Mortierella sp. AM989]
MTSEKIKLFCILDGDSSPFPVNLSCDETVGDLKKKIKEEKPNDLQGLDADKLILWHVFIPIEDDQDDNEDDKPFLLKDHQAEAKKIRAKQAATEIYKLFGTAPLKNTIHVIVERPTAAP